MTEHHQPAHDACENCSTALQGGYCHVCGQRAHNPLHSFSHAIEEVFESLWHLDGRIFRTMRDLLVPGRLAVNYLAGHRVRYIAPLRIFILLTLVTFFVAHFTIDFGENTIHFDAGRTAISDAKSAAEVIRLRDAALKELRDSRIEMEKRAPFATGAIDGGIAAVQQEAAQRIRELGAAHPNAPVSIEFDTSTAKTPAKPAHAGVQSDLGSLPETSDAPSGGTGASANGENLKLNFGDRAWDPAKDDVAFPWLPDFINVWATKKARNAAENFKRLDTDGDRLKDAWLRALPTSLFVMVPLFALLLKLLYLFTPRTYLEHLVVALYSHAWLMLAMLCIFLLADVVAIWSSITWVSVSFGLAMGAVGLWIPIYLLIMQKRVYRQHWLLTGVKFLVIGNLYVFMLSMTIFAAAAIGLVQM
jgi:hypothetical protein